MDFVVRERSYTPPPVPFTGKIGLNIVIIAHDGRGFKGRNIVCNAMPVVTNSALLPKLVVAEKTKFEITVVPRDSLCGVGVHKYSYSVEVKIEDARVVSNHSGAGSGDKEHEALLAALQDAFRVTAFSF